MSVAVVVGFLATVIAQPVGPRERTDFDPPLWLAIPVSIALLAVLAFGAIQWLRSRRDTRTTTEAADEAIHRRREERGY